MMIQTIDFWYLMNVIVEREGEVVSRVVLNVCVFEEVLVETRLLFIEEIFLWCKSANPVL